VSNEARTTSLDSLPKQDQEACEMAEGSDDELTSYYLLP
jgi:hypothetical protein